MWQDGPMNEPSAPRDPHYIIEQRKDLPAAAVTWLLLIAMALGFMLQDVNGRVFELRYALWPLGSEVVARSRGQWIEFGFAPWQLLSYALLHADLLHLLFNALALWMFGRGVEAVLGVGRFCIFLLITIVGSGVAQLITLALTLGPGEVAPTIGASGAVYAVLFAFAYLFPYRVVLPLVPLPAWLLVSFFAAMELYLGITQSSSNIAHFVHLGGMVFAWLLLRRWWKSGAIRTRERSSGPPQLPLS
jgi:membrane associated rhomboid family serine protease